MSNLEDVSKSQGGLGPPTACPVCGGRGNMPAEFYETPPPPGVTRESRTTAGLPVTCRSCSGTGLVWRKPA